MFKSKMAAGRYYNQDVICLLRVLSLLIIYLICTILLFNRFGAGMVTHRVRNDGFGAQFQAIIYTVVYAEFMNLRYVYTPLKSMEHNYDNDPDFLANKEKLINFKENFKLSDQNKKMKKIGAPSAIKYFEQHLNKTSQAKSLQHIKQIFRANKPADFFKNGKFNIAVHIRRENQHDYDAVLRAGIANKKFLEIIQQLRHTYADHDYLIHIYSQGKAEDFQEFNQDKIVLHLNDSVEDSFTGMVLANALVLSPSAFSYTAGLLSNGDVYYINGYWHPPLPHWKLV